jgi:light-regulated signal transduction histidine kinase (bacteriophytochrome)
VAITAVHDAKNNVIGFSKVTHDLTEKKAADDKLKLNAEQLEQKNKDLEKMNTELQSFAYVSSHDLQEPLRKIQTFASRILSKEMQTLSETGKDYFRRMQEAAGRMQTLIQDLLAYSRTNTTDRVFENVDLADIVNEVKMISKKRIQKKMQ